MFFLRVEISSENLLFKQLFLDSRDNKFNKIELIWKGSKYSSDPGTTNLEGLITRVNQIIEIISDTTDNSIIKQRLRDLQLKSILYEQ